jgi:hypothetical protein
LTRPRISFCMSQRRAFHASSSISKNDVIDGSRKSGRVGVGKVTTSELENSTGNLTARDLLTEGWDCLPDNIQLCRASRVGLSGTCFLIAKRGLNFKIRPQPISSCDSQNFASNFPVTKFFALPRLSGTNDERCNRHTLDDPHFALPVHSHFGRK